MFQGARLSAGRRRRKRTGREFEPGRLDTIVPLGTVEDASLVQLCLHEDVCDFTDTGSPPNTFSGDTLLPLATGVSPPGTGGTCRFRRRAAAPLGGNLGG